MSTYRVYYEDGLTFREISATTKGEAARLFYTACPNELIVRIVTPTEDLRSRYETDESFIKAALKT